MTFGTRMLIILYAAALVALGSAPLRNQSGGVVGYISQLSREVAGRDLALPRLRIPKELKVEIGDPKGRSTTQQIQSARGDRSGKQVEAFDEYAPKDRSALNSLLDKVAR